jgi:hypothetical protein
MVHVKYVLLIPIVQVVLQFVVQHLLAVHVLRIMIAADQLRHVDPLEIVFNVMQTVFVQQQVQILFVSLEIHVDLVKLIVIVLV